MSSRCLLVVVLRCDRLGFSLLVEFYVDVSVNASIGLVLDREDCHLIYGLIASTGKCIVDEFTAGLIRIIIYVAEL